MAFDFPPLQKKLLPTLAEALKAMRSADSRDEKSRDTRPLMAILMRVVEADPRLGGYVLTRRTALTSFDVVTEALDARGTPEAAAEVQARVRAVADTILDRACEISLYGALAIELEWEAGETGVTPRVVRDFDPDEVERVSRRREDMKLLTWTGSAAARRVAVPEDGTVLAAVDESHWTGGVLRSVLIREILLSDNLREWAGFTRKLKGVISGSFQGEVPQVGDPDRAAAETALQTLTQDNYALTSDRLKFEFSRLVEAASGGSFREFKAAMEADVSIAVLGQANTGELPSSGGSRAALQVLNLVRRDIHHSDIRRAEKMMSELLLWDHRLNVDPNATSSPYRMRVSIETDDGAAEEAETAARALGETLDALDGTGAGVLTDEAYSRIGYTRPEGLPDVLTRSRGTVPGLGGDV